MNHTPTPASPSTSESSQPDSELVHAAIAGSKAAFGHLVMRHRQSAVGTARGLLGCNDRAEDAAQQAFILAYTHLAELQQPARFKSWLLTITKRVALNQRVRTMPSLDISTLGEAVIRPPWAPQPDHSGDDLRESIRACLQDLSTRARRVVTLHYLDGYSCQEIGCKLGLPAGTVKRILHDSRKCLRAGMGLRPAPAKDAGGKTMNTEEKAYSKQGPRDMAWWINGSWPGPIMNSTIARSICLSVNKRAKTLKQIAQQVDANTVFVEEALEPLVGERLIAKTPNGRYRADHIVLDAEDWAGITKDICANGKAMADALLLDVPELERAWNATSQAAHGFDWNSGIWQMLAILVLNIGLSRNGESLPSLPAPTRASGKSYWAGGREEVEEKHVLWSTGFNNHSVPGGFGYGYFWSFGMPFGRPALGWPDDRRKVLGAIAGGASTTEAVAEAVGESVEAVRETLAKSIEGGFVETRENGLSLTFPVIRAEDDAVLAPVIDEVSARLYQQIVPSALAGVDDCLRRLGYGHLEEQFHQWRRWLEGNAAGEALRELYNRGVLPHPSNPAPMGFGMIGWEPGVRVMQWDQ